MLSPTGAAAIVRQRVALLDLPWLLLEFRRQHMHIAGVLVCRKPRDAGADFVGKLAAAMREHDHATAPLNRSLHRGGVNRWWPQWQTVPKVDLDYHLREVVLPAAGEASDLDTFVARLHEQPLDLDRPLWQVYVIDGVPDNRFAIYAKFHHAITDGVGATRILERALTAHPEHGPTPALWAGRDITSAPDGGRRRARLATVTKSPRALRLVARARRGGPRSRPYAAPRSVLNGTVTSNRQITTLTLATARLRDLAVAIDGTINDALLAACAAGLRAHLLDLDALPEQPLTAAVPVSLRPAPGAPERGRAGNALSFAFTDLATTTADHQQRTRLVVDSIGDAKSFLAEVPEDLRDTYTVMTMAPFIGSQLLGAAELGRPMFNVAVSNFAGPVARRYYGRAMIEAIHPVSILQSGQALNITALSYVDQLHVTFTACPDAVPHLTRLADRCARAVDELLAAHQ